VKLVSLYASNFKKLDFETPLRFRDGVTVIAGLNEAGKSTILDAILYALYSKVMKPPGHVKDEDLLAYTTGRATVTLEFTIGEKLYKATREIRRTGTNKATLEEHLGQDRWKVIATKSREVNATIESLLSNISFDEMISSTVVAQKDLDRLVEQGSDRWKVINAFLHLESFNEAIETLNEERKDLEGTGPTRPGQIRTEGDKLVELKRDLTECERRETENRDMNLEISALGNEIVSLTARFGELNSLHAQLTKYEETTTNQQRIVADAKAKQVQLDNHRAAVSTLQRQVDVSQSALSKYTDLPTEQEMSKVTELVGRIHDTDAEISRSEESIRTKSSEVSSVEKELQGYDKNAIEKTRATKVSLWPYAAGTVAAFALALALYGLSTRVLPWVAGAAGLVLLVLLVRQVSRMSKLVKLQGLYGKFELYEGKRRELDDLVGSLSRSKAGLEGAINSLRVVLDSVSYYKEVAPEKEPLERADLIVEQFSADSREKGSNQSSFTSLSQGLKALQSQMDETAVEREIAELSRKAAELVPPPLPAGVVFSKELVDRVIEERQQVHGKISDKQARVDSDRRAIDGNTAYLMQHMDIRKEVEARQELVRGLEHRLKVVKVAKEGIEKTAESRRVRFRPGVETYMGEILPSLTSGRYKAVMLDEDFGVQVFDPEAGEYRPKDVFSGGTEDQFLLAMRLAFALALMPEVKGTTPQFLWLDEPLGSSDEVRRSGIVEYLSVNLARLFSQIFIVSHVGGLEEEIPNVIRLENGKPVSERAREQ
jgi:exonuclease SbcC